MKDTKESSSIFYVPSIKFGYFYVCPLREESFNLEDSVECLLTPDIERILSPADSRKTIARILVANIIKHARTVIKDKKFYIHSYFNKNFVFYSVGEVASEAQATKLVKEIDSHPSTFPANELFFEKIKKFSSE